MHNRQLEENSGQVCDRSFRGMEERKRSQVKISWLKPFHLTQLPRFDGHACSHLASITMNEAVQKREVAFNYWRHL